MYKINENINSIKRVAKFVGISALAFTTAAAPLAPAVLNAAGTTTTTVDQVKDVAKNLASAQLKLDKAIAEYNNAMSKFNALASAGDNAGAAAAFADAQAASTKLVTAQDEFNIAKDAFDAVKVALPTTSHGVDAESKALDDATDKLEAAKNALLDAQDNGVKDLTSLQNAYKAAQTAFDAATKAYDATAPIDEKVVALAAVNSLTSEGLKAKALEAFNAVKNGAEGYKAITQLVATLKPIDAITAHAEKSAAAKAAAEARMAAEKAAAEKSAAATNLAGQQTAAAELANRQQQVAAISSHEDHSQDGAKAMAAQNAAKTLANTNAALAKEAADRAAAYAAQQKATADANAAKAASELSPADKKVVADREAAAAKAKAAADAAAAKAVKDAKPFYVKVNGKAVFTGKVGQLLGKHHVAHVNHLKAGTVSIVKSGSALKITGLKTDFGYKVSSVKFVTAKDGSVTANVTTSKVGYAVYVKYGKSNKKVVSGTFTYNKNLKRFSNKNHVSGTPKFVFKTSHGKKVLVVKGLKANKHYKITKVTVKYVKGAETAYVSVAKTR